MSIVKLEGTDENSQSPHESAAKTSPTVDDATSSAGAAAMALLQRGSTEPAVYVSFLRQHPDLRPMLARMLHQRFGNGFVMTVLGALDGSPARDDAQSTSAQQGTASGDSKGAHGLHGNVSKRPGVEGTVNQGLEHFDPAQLPEGTRPVSNGEHRSNVIAGIKGMRDGLFQSMKDGVRLAEGAAEERDKPPQAESSMLLSILGEAVSLVLAGSNATAGLWLANKIVRSGAKPEIELAKSAIKEVLKDSLHSVLAGRSPGARDLFPSLKQSFFTAVNGEFNNRNLLLQQGWSEYGDRLASLSDEELEQAHQHAVGAMAAAELQTRMMDTVLVSWTNFLAMVDNGHKGGTSGRRTVARGPCRRRTLPKPRSGKKRIHHSGTSIPPGPKTWSRLTEIRPGCQECSSTRGISILPPGSWRCSVTGTGRSPASTG